MNTKKESRILLKSHVNLSLAINIFIGVLAIWSKTGNHQILFWGIPLSLLAFLGGLLEVLMDIEPRRSLIAEYIGALIISCGLLVGTYCTSITAGIWNSIVILLEVLVTIAIIYRYDIKHKIKQILKQKKG